MSDWKEYKLGEVCSFVKDKISIRDVGAKVYISTENMLPDKGGITQSSSIPSEGMVTRYYPETILISNIRPYFKKIWLAKTDGGCSNDVLCFKGNDGLVNSNFLYYLLSQDTFFEYVMLGSKGCKMPRGDKDHIMKWNVLLPPIDEQKRIAGVLSSLDDKIDLLNRENATLEALAETLFRHYFIEKPDPTWKEGNIADVVDFNPARKLGKGEKAPYVEMANIGTNGYAPSSWRIRSFVSGTKFINGDTLMARISPCLENGKAAFVDFLEKEQVGWGSTEFIVMRSKLGIHPFFAYVLSRYDDFRDHAVSSLVGSSGRQRVDLDNLIKYPFIIPGKQAIELFNHELNTIFPKMQNNQKQILTLTAQRDTLLSRLMNGEVNVVE